MDHLATVRCQMTKWGDRPHWQFTGVHLGEDSHGRWIGFPTGTHNSRPGFAFDSEVDSVTLVPYDAWFLATFHAPGIWCDLYVDIATPAVWQGDLLTSTDLDLDVIRLTWGEAFIDDEDEFAEHTKVFAYPPEVVASARASADFVLAAVREGRPPFDGSHQRWLDLLARISGSGAGPSARRG